MIRVKFNSDHEKVPMTNDNTPSPQPMQQSPVKNTSGVSNEFKPKEEAK